MQTKKQKTPRRKWLVAAAPQKPVEIELRGELTLAAASGDGKGPRRFSMIAYDGGPMRPKVDPPIPHPVVVDLSGLDVSKQRYPALKDHDPKSLVGHTDKVTADSKLTAEGIISGTGSAATEVVASADNGFTWGVSMGAVFAKMELIPVGKSVSVNGRSVAGPVYVARKGRLRELSFLTLAADDDTAASIAAEAADTGEVMDFAAWLKANGFQPEKQNPAGKLIVLRAQFKACGGKKLEGDTLTNIQATLDAIEEPEATVKAGADDDTVAGDGNADAVVEMKAELQKIRHEQNVYRLCGEKHTEIAAKALAGNWGEDMIKMSIEAAELRASLPNSIQIRTNRAKDAPAEGIVLEAACALAGKLSGVEKMFDQKALNEAATRFRNGVGLQEILTIAAESNGYTGPGIKHDQAGVLKYAFSLDAAGQFSTISLPNILTSNTNRFLLDGYSQVDQAWRSIADIRPLNDFKPTTAWRMTGDAEFEELPPGGEIAHGELGEESYELQLKTYAKMYGINRTMIINDDLSAMSSIPRKLGRGAAISLNKKFWTAFLDHSDFFKAGNDNYSSGGGSALSVAGITAALTKFRRQEDPDGDPIAITPTILLVPPELEATALTLMAAMNLNTGGASTTDQVPNSNIYAGRFRVVVSPYLTDPAEWYLVASPNDVPIIAVGFLNGKEAPVIEQEASDFNTLGVLFRGYFDFGIGLQDFRGGVKSNGT